MQVDIKLPMIFNARLKGHRNMKTIAVHRSVARHLPSISSAEAPIVFEMGEGDIRHDGRTLGSPLWIQSGREELIIREFNGKLFRKLDGNFGRKSNIDEDPFPFHFHLSPIGKPLRQHFENRHFVLSRGLTYKTWPAFDPYNDVRNETRYEDLIPTITEYDQASVSTCIQMQERRMDGLLMIDGDVWMETSTPCIKVDIFESYVFEATQAIFIKTAFLPEWHDRTITTRYFPLYDIDGANAYVDELRTVFTRRTVDVIDQRSFKGEPGSAAMDFDAGSEFRERYLRGLAFNCGGFLLDPKNQSSKDQVSDPLALAFDEALRDNMVTMERVTMEPFSEDLVEFDRKNQFGYNQFLNRIHTKKALSLFKEYAHAQLDGGVINIFPSRNQNEDNKAAQRF